MTSLLAKRQMAEGLLYNFHFAEIRPQNRSVQFCIDLKDYLRENNMKLVANTSGQIEIRDRETNQEIARALFI
jgi:hypothetical protein